MLESQERLLIQRIQKVDESFVRTRSHFGLNRFSGSISLLSSFHFNCNSWYLLLWALGFSRSRMVIGPEEHGISLSERHDR